MKIPIPRKTVLILKHTPHVHGSKHSFKQNKPESGPKYCFHPHGRLSPSAPLDVTSDTEVEVADVSDEFVAATSDMYLSQRGVLLFDRKLLCVFSSIFTTGSGLCVLAGLDCLCLELLFICPFFTEFDFTGNAGFSSGNPLASSSESLKVSNSSSSSLDSSDISATVFGRDSKDARIAASI